MTIKENYEAGDYTLTELVTLDDSEMELDEMATGS